jgi:hypothetical protein
MLKGEKVVLRSMRRDDLPRLCEFNNDVAVELAGGGDPPFHNRSSGCMPSMMRRPARAAETARKSLLRRMRNSLANARSLTLESTG